jgi:hypothetical protein
MQPDSSGGIEGHFFSLVLLCLHIQSSFGKTQKRRICALFMQLSVKQIQIGRGREEGIRKLIFLPCTCLFCFIFLYLG